MLSFPDEGDAVEIGDLLESLVAGAPQYPQVNLRAQGEILGPLLEDVHQHGLHFWTHVIRQKHLGIPPGGAPGDLTALLDFPDGQVNGIRHR